LAVALVVVAAEVVVEGREAPAAGAGEAAARVAQEVVAVDSGEAPAGERADLAVRAVRDEVPAERAGPEELVDSAADLMVVVEAQGASAARVDLAAREALAAQEALADLAALVALDVLEWADPTAASVRVRVRAQVAPESVAPTAASDSVPARVQDAPESAALTAALASGQASERALQGQDFAPARTIPRLPPSRISAIWSTPM